MDTTTKIKVRKLSSGIVSYRLPGSLTARKFKGANATLLIPFEELQEAVYNADIKTLFDFGYLYIDDKAIRVELGLEFDETAGETGNVKSVILDKIGAIQILFDKGLSDADFETKIKNLAQESASLLIEVAIDNPQHAGYGRYEAIKRVFDVDVEAVKLKNRTEV